MPDAALAFRRARAGDVPAIVRMLADDPLGATRERDVRPLPDSYTRAFRAIDADPNNERALIEGVRVDRGERSQGLGRALFEWAIARARERGCHMVQLTTDKARPDARRFYECLGFVASHEGMKLRLG